MTKKQYGDEAERLLHRILRIVLVADDRIGDSPQ